MGKEIVVEDDEDSASSSFDEYLISVSQHEDLSDIFEYVRWINKINIHGYVLYKADLMRLQEGEWLNDSIINAYMQLIMNKMENVYIFSTFTYSMLQKTRPIVAAQWFEDLNIFSYSYILFPIFEKSHWTLIINETFLLRYYDSVGCYNERAMQIVSRFLTALFANKSKVERKIVHENMANYIPFQENCDDCGVFCCMFARFSVDKEIPDYFSTEDIPMLRRRILHEILAGELIYDYKDLKKQKGFPHTSDFCSPYPEKM